MWTNYISRLRPRCVLVRRVDWSSTSMGSTNAMYPANAANNPRDQTKYSIRPKIDPRQTSVILFPGQGSQYVGMCKDLLSYPNVPAMFLTASEILDFDLLDICLNGPQTVLDRTEHCQAAILIHSLAAIEKLKATNPDAVSNCVATCGFSSGEITALIFAGALSFQDGVKLIKARGTSMQAASELCPSGMLSVWCRPDHKINFACHAAREWCLRKGVEEPVCAVANYLFPQCKVIAGNVEALQFIESNAAQFGIKRLKHLRVSGGFHTQLMKPARGVLEAALEKCDFKEPAIAVHSNVDAKPYKGLKQTMVKKLLDQLTCPVKWEQIIHTVYERSAGAAFPNTFECGPGQTLGAILGKVNSKAAMHYRAIS